MCKMGAYIHNSAVDEARLREAEQRGTMRGVFEDITLIPLSASKTAAGWDF